MDVKELINNFVDHSLKAELCCRFWRTQTHWIYLMAPRVRKLAVDTLHMCRRSGFGLSRVLPTSTWAECSSMSICLLGILMSWNTEKESLYGFIIWYQIWNLRRVPLA